MSLYPHGAPTFDSPITHYLARARALSASSAIGIAPCGESTLVERIFYHTDIDAPQVIVDVPQSCMTASNHTHNSSTHIYAYPASVRTLCR